MKTYRLLVAGGLAAAAITPSPSSADCGALNDPSCAPCEASEGTCPWIGTVLPAGTNVASQVFIDEEGDIFLSSKADDAILWDCPKYKDEDKAYGGYFDEP